MIASVLTQIPDLTGHPYAGQLIRQSARRLVGKYGYTRSDVPDIEQELRLTLQLRAPGYDPRRGRITTFSRRVVESAVLSLLRKRMAAKRDYRRLRPLKDEPIHRDGRDSNRYSDLQMDVAEALAVLPPHQQELCERLMEVSVSECARQMGRTRYDIECDLAAIRERWRRAGIIELR